MEEAAAAMGEYLKSGEAVILPDVPVPDNRIVPMEEIPADAVIYEVTLETEIELDTRWSYDIIASEIVCLANIIHLAEMIFTCYIIGYIQVYLFRNFDECDQLEIREYAGIAVCTFLYCVVSYLGRWFDRNLPATLLFALYLLITYICVIFVYRSKRRIDDKQLNEELRMFQTEHKK